MAISIRFADANDTDAVAEVCNASFDPTTDHMTRNLFPEHLQPTGIPDGDALLPWRRSRKRYKLTEYRAVIMVAVDDELDGKVVGFTVWESPVYDNTEELERKEPKVPCDALDDAAFQEMKDVTNECFDNLFGKDGLRNMWCKYKDYHISKHMHIYINVHIYTEMHIYTHTYACTYTRTYIHIIIPYPYVCIICRCIDMRIRIDVYIHILTNRAFR